MIGSDDFHLPKSGDVYLRGRVLPNGIERFPLSVDGIYVEKGTGGNTRLIVRHEAEQFSLDLSEADCLHLAALLRGEPLPSRFGIEGVI